MPGAIAALASGASADHAVKPPKPNSVSMIPIITGRPTGGRSGSDKEGCEIAEEFRSAVMGISSHSAVSDETIRTFGDAAGGGAACGAAGMAGLGCGGIG
ncbi:hypothetical protein SAE02_38290 [Skermanella aerolata]|uniref:Uncharacterized protein n=1 Tax=Skermanella aerolata TaxID=393310 RepID=A0A512DT79_9PROT|nr:hypothetical protein SAE02_38290 [Skermanella aerolata]